MIAMALACGPQPDRRRRAHDGARRDGPGSRCSTVLAERVAGPRVWRWSSSATTCPCWPRPATGLAVMYAGRVVEQGPSDQVFEDAHHPYSRALAEAFPRSATDASATPPAGCPATRRSPATRRPGARSTRAARWPRRVRHHGCAAAPLRRSARGRPACSPRRVRHMSRARPGRPAASRSPFRGRGNAVRARRRRRRPQPRPRRDRRAGR